MRGKLAISKSGHDKNKVYVILKEEDRWIYLTDGRIKPVENPKKKNGKHVQIIKHLPAEVTELLSQDEEYRNEEVKRAIKLYCKSECNQEV